MKITIAWLIALLLAVAAATLVWQWPWTGPNAGAPDTAAAPERREPSVVLEELTPPEGADETEDGAEAGVETARRLVAVPDTRPDQARPGDKEEPVTAENMVAKIEAGIGEGLGGDLAAAHGVMENALACREFPRTREALEQRNQMLFRNLERGRGRNWSWANNDRDWPNRMYDNEADIVANNERWFEACARMRKFFSSDYRRELDRLARGGHVVARYLFAMLPPDDAEPASVFEERFAWEHKAREYSMANLQEGEPAGLLAFGWSYQASLFTARDFRLGMAFNIAAVNCGVAVPRVEQSVEAVLNQVQDSESSEYQQWIIYALQASEGLARYCRN